MVSGKPETCVHGDHQWPPPPSEVWVTGDGVHHQWRDGQGWVHDESVEPGTPLVIGLESSEPDPADALGSVAWYERVAVDAFTQAKADADDLHELVRRTPVWEEMCAKFAAVTARFAEAGAAATLASAFRRAEPGR